MKRSKKGLYATLLTLALIGGGGYFIASSKLFERNPPKVDIADSIYWNLKEPLHLSLSDDTGIKSYKIIIDDGEKKETLDMQEFANPQKRLLLNLRPPVDMDFAKSKAQLIIQAKDQSFWHYFLGNSLYKRVTIFVDTKKPDLFVVNNSYAITKGGSALVVFYCKDENLKDFYIKTNFGKRFEAEPFYKDGYYAALIAWPITSDTFQANIFAEDMAGNKARAHIPLYLRKKRYKKSKIKLSDRFLDGKIVELAEDYPQTKNMDKIERFKFVNEKLRAINEKLIHTLSSKVPQKRISDFNIKPFYPLKNAAKVASFGDHRFYYYNGKLVSEAYHMGLDLASTKMAKIKASNPAHVVFANYNGIYGNMPLLSHGLGLYTLYGHCSTLFVHKGDNVSRGQTIAKTGMTGLALGDHLHFGVVVQGIEVRPEEWMDRRWIKLNITNVLKDAKKIIDSK